MYKESLSKSITGLKNKNNKRIFLTRNEYFEKYVLNFKENVGKNLEMFDQLRSKEALYKNSWNKTISTLQNIK
jgi:hypothetical protein